MSRLTQRYNYQEIPGPLVWWTPTASSMLTLDHSEAQHTDDLAAELARLKAAGATTTLNSTALQTIDPTAR